MTANNYYWRTVRNIKQSKGEVVLYGQKMNDLRHYTSECGGYVAWIRKRLLPRPSVGYHPAVAPELSQDHELPPNSLGRKDCGHVCVKATYSSTSPGNLTPKADNITEITVYLVYM